MKELFVKSVPRAAIKFSKAGKINAIRDSPDVGGWEDGGVLQ